MCNDYELRALSRSEDEEAYKRAADWWRIPPLDRAHIWATLQCSACKGAVTETRVELFDGAGVRNVSALECGCGNVWQFRPRRA